MAESASAAAAAAVLISNFQYSISARRGVISMQNANVSTFSKSRVSTPTKRAGMVVSCVKTSDAVVNNKSNDSISARRGVISMQNANVSTFSKSRVSTPTKRAGMVVSCVKTSDAVVNNKSNGSLEKSTPRGATFPSGCEELVAGVCDETQIAELKIKIGDFEMHLKRNINSAEAPVAEAPMLFASPTEAPPIPSKPMSEFSPAAAPSSSVKAKETPLINDSVKKSRKLAALEASGATGYVLVSSPTVGSFRKARTLKGKKQPPACKEGDVIKEGKTICYLDQFGTELPVKSDVDGEVIKILFDDGEAVGYGDPLIAVLPSFHDTIAV